MIRLSARLIVPFIVLALLYSVSSAYPEDFIQYCNPRFGFCIDHPRGLSKEPDPDNGDGRSFYDSNGFKLIASGINNVVDDTLATEMKLQSNDFLKITYRAKSENWFVLSGYIGPDIAYYKTYIGKGSINHLHIRYPAKVRAKYSDIVTKISQSFKPGDLEESH